MTFFSDKTSTSTLTKEFSLIHYKSTQEFSYFLSTTDVIYAASRALSSNKISIYIIWFVGSLCKKYILNFFLSLVQQFSTYDDTSINNFLSFWFGGKVRNSKLSLDAFAVICLFTRRKRERKTSSG